MLPSPFVKPAGVAGTQTVGGFTPDWAKLIATDPGLLQIEQTLGAGSVGDLASRNGAIQNAVEQFGAAPSDLAQLAQSLGMSQADLQNILGPDVQQLAKENTDAGLSTQARLNLANQQAIAQIKENLNKRGMLNSGAAGQALGQQDLSFRQAQFDANAKLLQALQQYQQGYLSAQNQRATTLAQGISDAATRQEQANPSVPGVPANFAFTSDSGQPVYQGPDGTLYNQDGTVYPYAAPNASAPGYNGGTILGGNVHSRLA